MCAWVLRPSSSVVVQPFGLPFQRPNVSTAVYRSSLIFGEVESGGYRWDGKWDGIGFNVDEFAFGMVSDLPFLRPLTAKSPIHDLFSAHFHHREQITI